ncbi:LysR substrate-binding domain-containing protein, partial [Paraburkholderia caribensis]|uniref:LysR substrate-binding domain-containing protein n=1 Tax=Paraburkholderia caribensis TaxID=75105 RepID=UPI003F4932D4
GGAGGGRAPGPPPPPSAPRLSWLPLAREPLVIAMSTEMAARIELDAEFDAAGDGASGAGAAEWRDEPLSLAQAGDAPLVVFPRRLAPGFYDMIMDCYGAAGLTPHIGQEAIQMQTIVSLVSAGMGVALVPQSLRNLRRTGV